MITADDAQNRRAGFVECTKQFPPIACRSSALGRKTAMNLSEFSQENVSGQSIHDQDVLLGTRTSGEHFRVG